MPVSSDAVSQGWRLLHIGFEGDDVSVAGINPWQVENWIGTGETITVAHPSYPAQRHTMWVYVLDPKQAESVFAAGEFSNGVWGIYVPTASRIPLAPPGRTSRERPLNRALCSSYRDLGR